MRNAAFISLLVLLAPTPMAVATQPIFIKRDWSGYVLPEWVRHRTCEGSSEKVVITTTYGANEDLKYNTTEEIKVATSPSISNVLRRAATEPVTETPNMICDLPGSNIILFVGGDEITLLASGGCGDPKKERNGPASRMLLEMIIGYCGAD